MIIDDDGRQVPALCHCSDCQRTSGSAYYAAYVVPRNSLVITKGDPGRFDSVGDSGRPISRLFCRDCGSKVWAETGSGQFASVNGLSLDDAAAHLSRHIIIS